MSELRIYGASDDLMEFEGALVEEFSGDNEIVVKLKSKSTGEKCLVVASYRSTDTWLVAPLQWDEYTLLPDWNFRTSQMPERSYSTVLVCDVPDDIKVKEVSL